jgi:hypothetical protein
LMISQATLTTLDSPKIEGRKLIIKQMNEAESYYKTFRLSYTMLKFLYKMFWPF